MYEWCNKWRIEINFSKTEAMHFKNKGRRCSYFEFKIGHDIIEYTVCYRYLGVHIDEHLDFSVTAQTLPKASGRAHGVINSKVQSYKDVGFRTYSKMFQSCVVLVMDYCSGNSLTKFT